MWGPQQTRRDTCRPLQAWSFVGQLCMCSKWALPARRHWGAHFMVSPLTAVAHSRLLCVCVCVCVICTFRGGSLCSVGLDASFGSGLLRPLCDVVSLPSAESEPLYFAG